MAVLFGLAWSFGAGLWTASCVLSGGRDHVALVFAAVCALAAVATAWRAGVDAP